MRDAQALELLRQAWQLAQRDEKRAIAELRNLSTLPSNAGA
jgi:hypothetical protein